VQCSQDHCVAREEGALARRQPKEMCRPLDMCVSQSNGVTRQGCASAVGIVSPV
jgi:hypothetical protein